MKKTPRIFFIGRKHGIIPFRARPWKLEYQRRGELDGFKAAHGIKRTFSPARADVIFVRNKQQATNENDIQNIEKRIGKFRSKKLILNDIAYFKDYNSKEQTLSLWQKNNLPIPAYKILDIRSSAEQHSAEVTTFLAQYPSMILRSTNDEGGLGMFFIHEAMSRDEVSEKVNECRAHIIQHKGLRKDSGLMAVEYIGNLRSDEYQYLCRAYCVGNSIVTISIVAGKNNNLHAASMGPEDFDHFVSINEKVAPLLHNDPFGPMVLKAVECLNIKMCAVDFMYRDNAIFFLEVNPIWGGLHTFGNDDFMARLYQERSALSVKIPPIYELIDAVPFYKKFYEAVGTYTRTHYS